MKRSIYIYLAAVVLMGAGACTKFSDNLNVNPNLPTTPSNAQFLTSAIDAIPGVIEDPIGSLYTQQLAEKPYTDNSRYITVNFNFYSIYAGPLEDLQQILKATYFNPKEGSKNNQLATARILKAWYFWHITDRWGDVPYFNALKGAENFTPKYDSQKDIYYDLLKELKEAAAQIKDDSAVAGDNLYGGNMDNWRRFANSMRMLMALRLSKVDPAKGKTEFTDALAGGVFQANNQSAVYVHLNATPKQNYWYYVANVQERPWYWASKTIVDTMKPLGDPRLKIFADPTPSTGDYVGVPYGLDANAISAISSSKVSFMGVHLRTQNAPCYIVTYPEILLAIAEADKIGWLAGGDADAQDKYNKAIEASVRQWNRTTFKAYKDDRDNQIEKIPFDADDPGDTTGLAAYMAQPTVVYNSAKALQQIGTQRWIHLYMNGYEAWAEWRRTGYPALNPAPNNGNIPIPRRQGYPAQEKNINTKNYNEALTNQPSLGGADDLKGRVWWDK